MNFEKRTLVNVAAALVLCAAVTSGCASNKVGPGVRPEQPIIPGEVPSEVTKTDASFLTVAVSATPESQDAAALAARLQSSAETTLIGNGFTIAAKKPDVLMAMSVRQQTFDKSGNYYQLDGSVPSVKVVVPEDNARVVASGQFPIERGERVLGIEKAVASVGDKLVSKVDKWTAENVRPANFDLAAVTVVVKRNTLFYKSKDPIYVAKFAERIAKVDGVRSCELVSGEVATRLWEFRIVYVKTKFPGGLVNTLIKTCQDLDIELNR